MLPKSLADDDPIHKYTSFSTACPKPDTAEDLLMSRAPSLGLFRERGLEIPQSDPPPSIDVVFELTEPVGLSISYFLLLRLLLRYQDC